MARDLFEARKAGKSKTDIDTIANESGIANLERELETFILDTSERNEFVRRRIADVLQECNTFCRSEMDRLDGEIKSFDLDVVQLEADLNEAKKAAKPFGPNATEHSSLLRGNGIAALQI